MNDGEKMIWAAAFSTAIGHGSSERVAVMRAERAVQRFRGIDTEALAPGEREQVEAMRWPGGHEVLAMVKKVQAKADATMVQSAKIQALAVDLTAERDALQLEVERLGRVKAVTPDQVFEALRIADAESGRLREVLHRVRDDLAGDGPEVESALSRLAEVLG